MLLHLLTSDASAFRLVDLLSQVADIEIACVVVPANRLGSKKIDAVFAEATIRGLRIAVHQLRSRFANDLPVADAAVSWMYSQIIRTEDLNRYPEGTLNMHGGFIPEYRGANVLQWAIINGEAALGVTWHQMVEKVDAGAIWAEGEIPISSDATASEIRVLMIEKAIELLPTAWINMTSKRPARMPELSGGKIWPPRRPEDGRIHPRATEQALRNLVRALCPPWPPAFLVIDGERVPITKVTSEDSTAAIPYVTAEGHEVYLLTDGEAKS